MLIRQASTYKHDFFTHNSMLFIFSTITYKMTQISYSHKQSISRSLHDHEPFFFSIHQQISMIPKNSTKPEDISLGIKTKLEPNPRLPGTIPKNFQYSVPKSCPDCPKIVLKIQLRLSENSPENSVQTVRK